MLSIVSIAFQLFAILFAFVHAKRMLLGMIELNDKVDSLIASERARKANNKYVASSASHTQKQLVGRSEMGKVARADRARAHNQK